MTVQLIDNKPRKRIVLNPMQVLLEIAQQRIRTVQVGRAGGKSTGAAIDMKTVIYDMPRSKNFVQTETYQQGLTLTLPSTVKALDMIGFKKDIHYFVGRKPPKSWRWEEAWEPPLDPKHSIYFYNGTVYDLLSQDVSSRGANYSAGMCDEAQNIDPQKFQAETIPTMRGEAKRFENRKTYRRLSLYCSMPRTRRAEWIFEYEKLAEQYPEEYLWISGPSRVNAVNLPDGWFTDQKKLLMPSEYDIEIKNIRPKRVLGGFYPFFDDNEHTYTAFNNDFFYGKIDNSNGYEVDDFNDLNCMQDADLLVNEPLDISMDYGAWFNGIVTGQESRNTFRWLSAMSIDENKRFEDLLKMWCEYYRFHRNKVAYYWYDHTALDRDARAEEYPEIVKRVLHNYGWDVRDMYIGGQPSADDRYRFMGWLHRGDREGLPRVAYNRHHCKYLIISLNNAKVKQGTTGYRKDKSDEQNHDIDQRTTTHFSDAHDTLLMGKYAHLTMPTTRVPGPRTS